MKWRDVGRLAWRVEWKPADCWVGAFWRRSDDGSLLHVWVCPVPMVPLHVVWRSL